MDGGATVSGPTTEAGKALLVPAVARSLVCAIDKHENCDGNAPNGPAGIGSPCRCVCHVPERIAAIEAEAKLDFIQSSLPSLLAEALRPHFGPSYFPNLTDVTIHGDSPEEIATAIATKIAELYSK